MNLWLIFIWWYTGGGFPWFAIVLVLWGIGLVANFVTAFMGTGVTDRMAEREFQKLKQGKEWWGAIVENSTVSVKPTVEVLL